MPDLPTSGRGFSSWPTPVATNPNEGETIDSWQARSDALLAGGSRPLGLPLALAARKWSTPRASAGENLTTKPRPSEATGHGRTLAGDASMWPTPCVTDAAGARRETARTSEWKSNPGTTLTDATWKWPTPTTQDAENNAGPSQFDRNSDPLNVAAAKAVGYAPSRPAETTPKGGPRTSSDSPVLNPRFVEALMGWPANWSAVCDCNKRNR